MHFITEVKYETGHRSLLPFEDGSRRRGDLADYLDGEMFEPFRNLELLQTAYLNAGIDTVVWDNGADMSPDFLYDIGEPVDGEQAHKVAEERAVYVLHDNEGRAKEWAVERQPCLRCSLPSARRRVHVPPNGMPVPPRERGVCPCLFFAARQG